MDGNFIAVCLKRQIDPVDSVRKVLQLKYNEPCEFLVPEGVVNELALLGPGFEEAVAYAKKLLMPNEIADQMSAHEHIESIIGD